MQYNQDQYANADMDGHPGPLCPECNEPSKSVPSAKNGGRAFWTATCRCGVEQNSQYGKFFCWDDEYVANNYQIPPKTFKRKANNQGFSQQPAKVARPADETATLVMMQKVMDMESTWNERSDKLTRDLEELNRKIEENTELTKAAIDLLKLNPINKAPIQTQMNPAKKFKSIADKG